MGRLPVEKGWVVDLRRNGEVLAYGIACRTKDGQVWRSKAVALPPTEESLFTCRRVLGKMMRMGSMDPTHWEKDDGAEHPYSRDSEGIRESLS